MKCNNLFPAKKKKYSVNERFIKLQPFKNIFQKLGSFMFLSFLHLSTCKCLKGERPWSIFEKIAFYLVEWENCKLVHNSSVSAASVSSPVILLPSLCIIKNKSECLKIRVYSTKKLQKMKFHLVGNIQLSLSFNFLLMNLLLLLCFISFCLKGEGLDGSYPAVIDYTPYLKFTQRYF